MPESVEQFCERAEGVISLSKGQLVAGQAETIVAQMVDDLPRAVEIIQEQQRKLCVTILQARLLAFYEESHADVYPRFDKERAQIQQQINELMDEHHETTT